MWPSASVSLPWLRPRSPKKKSFMYHCFLCKILQPTAPLLQVIWRIWHQWGCASETTVLLIAGHLSLCPSLIPPASWSSFSLKIHRHVRSWELHASGYTPWSTKDYWSRRVEDERWQKCVHNVMMMCEV